MNGTQTGCEKLTNGFCPSGVSIYWSGQTTCCNWEMWGNGCACIRVWRAVRAETGIIAAAVCSDFYHLYCIAPLPSPQPLSPAFILYPYFLFEGAPTRSLRSSWSRPPPTTDRLRTWTGNEPRIKPRGRGQDLGKRRSGEMIKPLMNVMFCCLFFPNIIGFVWIFAIWNPSTHERT